MGDQLQLTDAGLTETRVVASGAASEVSTVSAYVCVCVCMCMYVCVCAGGLCKLVVTAFKKFNIVVNGRRPNGGKWCGEGSWSCHTNPQSGMQHHRQQRTTKQ